MFGDNNLAQEMYKKVKWIMEHIGVCVLVLDKNHKKVLLGKRMNSYRAGMLGVPGGRLDLEEPLEECGKRELVEETSLVASDLKYIGVVRELQEGYNFIHFAFVCSYYTGTPTVIEPIKCESWEWYPIDNLPENILPGHKAALDIFLHPNQLSVRDLLTKE